MRKDDIKIEIQLSKAKLILLLTGAAAFVALGFLLILAPDQLSTGLFRNPEIVRIAGIASVVFFGLCLVFIARKLFDNRVGLVIDQNGITDNSNATSVGLIEWKDITGIETLQISTTKILVIKTDQPDKYIERAKNGLSKRAMKANHKMYGSPLSITSNSLKINFKELEKLLTTELEKRQTPDPIK